MGSRETSRELKVVLLDVSSAAAPTGVVVGTDADKAPRSPQKKSATRPTSRALGWAPEGGAESSAEPAKGTSGSKDGASSDRKGASGGVERGPSKESNGEVSKKEASTGAGRAKGEGSVAAADGKLVGKGAKRSDDDKDGGRDGGSKESGKEGFEEEGGGKEGGKEGGNELTGAHVAGLPTEGALGGCS